MNLVSICTTTLLGVTAGGDPSQPVLRGPDLVRAPTPVYDDVYDDRVPGFYLRLTGGFTTLNDSSGPDEDIDFDEGFLLSVGLGDRLSASSNGVGFSLELDGVLTQQDANNQGTIDAVSDVSVAGALLDGILDFRLMDRLSLYAGAGIGLAWLDVGTKSDALHDFSDEDGPFLAWQAKAGLAWRFATTTSLHFGYRFLNIDDAEIDDGIGGASFNLQTEEHVLEAGLLFGF